MRSFLIPVVAVAFLLTSACSDAPKEEVKTPEKPPAPITGRQGFQMTYPSARAWAPDATPLLVRSMNLESVNPEPGWVVMWGASAGTAGHVVRVGSTTGKVLGAE